MKLYFLVLIISGLLSACTPELNQESVKTFSNHSLDDFIKDRFTFNNALNHAVYSGLDTISPQTIHSLYSYHAESKPLADGSYVFYAPFDSVATLETPKHELALFCGIKGGQLKTLFSYSKDILSLYKSNPLQAYAESVRELSHVRVSTSIGAYEFSRSLNDNEINSVAMAESIRVMKENQYSEITYAKKDYFAAVRAESFGIFDCENISAKKILWRVSIIPIAYEHSDKEHFLMNALYIGIKSIEMSSKTRSAP